MAHIPHSVTQGRTAVLEPDWTKCREIHRGGAHVLYCDGAAHWALLADQHIEREGPCRCGHCWIPDCACGLPKAA